MFKLFSDNKVKTPELQSSGLYDQNSFYKAFLRDLNHCQSEAVIESPFVTGNRVTGMLATFSKMASQNIKITVNTRHPSEHEWPYNEHASRAIEELKSLGIQVLYTGGHHRKLAIIDRHILWEGSLNILSQNDSCEIMRRTDSHLLAKQMISFIKIDRFLN